MVGRAVYLPWRVSRKLCFPVARNPVTAPTSSSGAVSPNARAIARMAPVSTPGAAYGSTWLRTTSHRVAPTP